MLCSFGVAQVVWEARRSSWPLFTVLVLFPSSLAHHSSSLAFPPDPGATWCWKQPERDVGRLESLAGRPGSGDVGQERSQGSGTGGRIQLGPLDAGRGQQPGDLAAVG